MGNNISGPGTCAALAQGFTDSQMGNQVLFNFGRIENMWAVCGEKTHILPTTHQYSVHKQPTYYQRPLSLHIVPTFYQQMVNHLPTYQYFLFIFPT